MLKNDKNFLLSVVIPCYNERHTLRESLRRVQAVPINKEIIIVDDCSKDGTDQILKEISKNQPEIKVFSHQKNMGKGAALRSGFSKVSGDIVIIQDADLEYEPEEYPRLIQPILDGKADVVYGSRFTGSPTQVLSFWHTLMNRSLTLFSNMLTNLNLTDMETCYKVFRSDILKAITTKSNRFGFEPEFTQKIARMNYRIFEVPISYAGRGYEQGKKITWRDGLAAIYTILRYWLIDDRPQSSIGYQTLSRLQKLKKYNGWIYKTIDPWLGENILEIGAGTGNITRLLINGAKVHATEIVEDNRNILNKNFKFNDDVTIGKLDLNSFEVAQYQKKNFDTIVMLNVLEHIENDERALAGVAKIISDKAKFILLTPAHKLLYGSLDKNLDHCRRYSKKELKVLLEKNGLTVEKIFYFNSLGTLGWFINSKIIRRKILGRLQLRIFEIISPLAKLIDKLPLPLGLSLIAICKKTRAEKSNYGRN